MNEWRDQSVSPLEMQIFVTCDTKGKESTARLRATKEPRPLKGARPLRVTARRHRKETPLSFTPLEIASRGERVQERGERNLSRTATNNSVPDDGRIACNVTPTDADRRKVVSGKSGVLRSSRLRIDPIEISFKPPDRTVLAASRRDQDVRFCRRRTIRRLEETSDERSSIWRALKCTRDARSPGSTRLRFIRVLKKRG